MKMASISQGPYENYDISQFCQRIKTTIYFDRGQKPQVLTWIVILLQTHIQFSLKNFFHFMLFGF